MIKGKITSREEVSKGEKIIPGDASLRVRPEVRQWLIRVGVVFAVGALIMAGTVAPSLALEAKSVADGLNACEKWCDANNPGPANNLKCKQNCVKYWCCNGSDARSANNRFCCTNAGGVTAVKTKDPMTLGPAKIEPQGTLTTKPQTPPQSPAKTNPQGTVTTP